MRVDYPQVLMIELVCRERQNAGCGIGEVLDQRWEPEGVVVLGGGGVHESVKIILYRVNRNAVVK